VRALVQRGPRGLEVTITGRCVTTLSEAEGLGMTMFDDCRPGQ
jgi:hypothetical protein